MKINFTRDNTFLGFAVNMRIYVDGQKVGSVAHDSSFTFECVDAKQIVIDRFMMIKKCIINLDKPYEELDIKLMFLFGMMFTRVQAIVSSQGQIIGVFK